VKVTTRTNDTHKNYQQMTQKLYHLQHPVFMNSPDQTAMYIKRTLKKIK